MTNLALNPFKKGKKTEVEGVRKVDVEGESWLENALDQYNYFVMQCNNHKDYNKSLSNLEKLDLEPKKINSFLSYLIKSDNIGSVYNINTIMTGLFFSKLVQDSYNAGNNDFTLSTGKYIKYDLSLDGFARLNGKENNLLRVKLQGNSGVHLGYESNYTLFYVQGSIPEGDIAAAQNCVYATSDFSTYEDLHRFVEINKTNKIRFAHSYKELLEGLKNEQ